MISKRIGVIGLGDMGLPMARRLLHRGFTVVSCAHRRREAIEALAKEGLIEKPDPSSVAGEVELLLSIVVDEKQTDAVLRGPQGALAGLSRGSIVVIMSTVSPNYCLRIAEEAAQRGIAVLDCPITGGNAAAAQGTLGLIVGGSATELERCRDILSIFGTTYHCGDVGMGQVAKLANNAVAFATVAVVDEARTMAAAYGLDLGVLMQILGKGTAQSFIADKWDYVATHWAHLQPLGRKDINLFLQAANARDIATHLVGKVHESDLIINSDKRAR